MKQNKKGVSLIMAIMVITMLFIMAAGFFTFTINSNNNVQAQIDKVRLYWAAESGSNFSVSWWSAQEKNIRMDWPYYYDPSESVVVGKSYAASNDGSDVTPANLRSGDSDGGFDIEPDKQKWDYDFEDGTDEDDDDDDDWDTNLNVLYKDVSGHIATFNNVYSLGSLPLTCKGITSGDSLHLHSSSEIIHLKYPDSNETYTLYLLRYKGRRADAEKGAVWVMDTWAVDDETKSTYRILMSDLYNFIQTDPTWLQYNEGMVHTQYTSTQGRKGVFKAYDFRFGQSYFAENVRFDYMSGRDKAGPTFYGQIDSSSPTASEWGNGGSTTDFIQGNGIAFEKGVYVENNSFTSETEAVTTINTSVLGGWDAIEPINSTDIVWEWSTIKKESSNTPSGIYMLNPEQGYPIGATIQVEVGTTDLTPDNTSDNEWATWAKISQGGVFVETVNISSSGVEAIAVPWEYGDVSIFGNSSDNFSLMTEESPVAVIGDFYLKELEPIRQTLLDNYSNLAKPSMEIMADVYEAMYLKDVDGNLIADSHLSIMSGINLYDQSVLDLTGVPAAGNRSNQLDITSLGGELLFTTTGFYLGYGDIGLPAGRQAPRFFNIGSVILNSQIEVSGSNSFQGTIAYVQDKRFYDQDFAGGVGWGAGPDDESAPTAGLNEDYRWTGGYAGSNVVTEQAFLDLRKF